MLRETASSEKEKSAAAWAFSHRISVGKFTDTLPDSEAATTSGNAGIVNWLPSSLAPSQQDLLEDQLIENDNATPYPSVSYTSGGGPRMKLGWRGAYLNGPIVADPWNHRYQVNTIFLTVDRRGGAPIDSDFETRLLQFLQLIAAIGASVEVGKNGRSPFGMQ